MEYMLYESHCSFDSSTCCLYSGIGSALHTHVNFYEFCLFTSGNYRNTYKNQEAILSPGYLLFYKPGEAHELIPMEEGSEHCSFIIEREYFEEHWKNYWQAKAYYGDISTLPTSFCKEIPMAQYMYLSQLASALAYNFSPESRPISDQFLDTLLFTVCNTLPMGTRVGVDYYVNELIRCFDACRLLELEISEICNSFPVSQRALSEHFKATTGYAMLEYRNKKKMEYAAHLLQKDNYSVSIVADKLKISCQSYFIRQFKKQFGMTPKQYQMLYRKDNM